ncbi:MAG: cyclase family protein [Halodesulfurarchaeum sp.]
MVDFVDLTHTFRDGMPGFRVSTGDGTTTELTATIQPFLTHEETHPLFDGRCSFEITEMHFQTSVGTYLDSPAHRFAGRRDIGDIDLSEVVNEGVVVDVTGRGPYERVGNEVIPDEVDLDGKAVLFNFGWDQYWGTEAYREYPFIGADLVDHLLAEDVALVGVDTINVDDDRNPDRPAHTKLLQRDVFVVENLCRLDEIPDEPFRFFAIPIKADGVVAMPVRAFAEVAD